MSDFQLAYALRSVLTGSHQDVIDVQLYRASIVEQKLNERHGMTSDAYVKQHQLIWGGMSSLYFFCRLLNKCKIQDVYLYKKGGDNYVIARIKFLHSSYS